MKTFTVLTKEQVSPANQALFDNLTQKLGSVPNLYAAFAYSENALGNYLTLHNGKTSLKPRELEVINLVTSQVNGCRYCLSAHTVVAKGQGFTDEQVLEIRTAKLTFDRKLDALARLAKSVAENKGHADAQLVTNFYAAGYDQGGLVDVVMAICGRTISNYMHALTGVPIDFPIAPALSPESLETVSTAI